jgi:serine phosphatase RsbU (regulator of sigma subunit)
LIWTSVIALVLSLGSFYLNQWVFSSSDDECTWVRETQRVTENGKKVVRKRAVIREILPNGVAEDAGLLEGDELLMIQGKKVDPDRLGTDAQAFINEQPEGRILVYVVRRYDFAKKEYRILPLPVRITKPFHPTPLLVLLSGLIAWGLGLLVVASSPQRKIARHFYYLGVMALLLPLAVRGFMGNVPTYLVVPYLFVAQLVLAIAPPLWLHFFLRFPHSFPLRTNRRFLVGLYGGFVCLGLFIFVAQLAGVFLGPALIGEIIRNTPIRWLFYIFNAAIACTLVSGIVLFWVGAFKLEERRRWALLSALIFSSAVLLDLLAFYFLSARAGQSLMFQRESWIFFAPLPLLPLSFAYAILRHGFFDVQRALVRWVTYFVVLGVTLIAYLGGLAWVFAQGMQSVPPGWVGALVGLSAIPIGWLLRWLLQALRRKFRRDLSQARDQILGCLRETRQRLAEEALLAGLKTSLHEAFLPQLLLVLSVEGQSVTLPPTQDPDADAGMVEALRRPRKLELPSQLLRHARENQELVLGLGEDEADWIREQGEAVRAHMDALQAQVLVLLMANQKPHTIILLGGKYAELSYGREDRELLREVAQAAGIILETTILHRRLLDQGRIEQELQTARKIQESLITFEAPAIQGYQLALRLEPALETGGDLLWVKRRKHGKWIAAVGDVSGKGLAAALYMSQATALLKFATQSENLDFDRILPALDRTMRNLMGSRDFLTLILLEWDESGSYRIARAGHPPALVMRGPRREDIEELTSIGRGLGLRPASEGEWQIHEGILQPGEWVVMYSDGLTEAMNQAGELYGLARMEDQLLRMRATGSARAACEAVYRDVATFECQNRDDRTLFILGRDAL